MRLLWAAVLILVAELVVFAVYWSDSTNWDCGGPCSAGSRVLGMLWLVILPLLFLIVIGLGIRRWMRQRGSGGETKR